MPETANKKERSFCLFGSAPEVSDSPRKPRFKRGLRDNGFSLIEMLLYVAILAAVLLVVTETLIGAVSSTGALRAAQRIEESASVSLGRIVREIRGAQGVDLALSAFGTSPGVLTLNTTDASGAPRAVKFYLGNGVLYVEESGELASPLSSARASVSSLVFYRIATGRSEGVKIEMAVSAGSGSVSRSENFYATAVLRDSY